MASVAAYTLVHIPLMTAQRPSCILTLPRVWTDPTGVRRKPTHSMSGGTDEPGHLFTARVPAMLEIHPASDGFTVYDTDADEPIIKFTTRAEADELIAALQIQDVHAQLKRWSPDAGPNAY